MDIVEILFTLTSSINAKVKFKVNHETPTAEMVIEFVLVAAKKAVH